MTYRIYSDPSKRNLEDKIKQALVECKRNHGVQPDLVGVRAVDIDNLTAVYDIPVVVSTSGMVLQPGSFELRVQDAAPVVPSVEQVTQATLF